MNDNRTPEVKAAHDEMANAIIRTLRGLQTAVSESESMRQQWAANPVACLGLMITVVEARHVKGLSREALVVLADGPEGEKA